MDILQRFEAFRRSAVAGSVLGLIALGGCALDPYRAAVREDDPAAYYRFIQENPDSRHVDEAKERLAYVEVERDPSVSGFEAFYAEYPDSDFLDDLRPLIEPLAFEIARDEGTAQAYEAFLERFPDGEHRMRAEGNAAFERTDGYAGRLGELGDFAVAHPESDFAAEAERSVEAIRSRATQRYASVSLIYDIESFQVERDTLIRTFTEQAVGDYQAYGRTLDLSAVGQTDVEATIAAAEGDHLWVVVRHREERREGRLSEEGELIPPSVDAKTTVSLRSASHQGPIWERDFGLSLEVKRVPAGKSPLLGTHSEQYWARWFAPVATWDVAVAVRPAESLPQRPVAIDAARNRVAVLGADGSLNVLYLADPDQPPVTLAMVRSSDRLAGWGGVHIHEGKILLYGEAGVATLDFNGTNPDPVVKWSGSQLGTVSAIEVVDAGLLMATSRGLWFSPGGSGAPVGLIGQPVHGMAAVGDAIVFTGPQTLFISTLANLREQRVSNTLPLGNQFVARGGGRVRSFGNTAVVIGNTETLIVDLENASQPRFMARLPVEVTGAVHDAVRVNGRLFLLGDRGLQQLSVDSTRVSESVAMETRGRVVRMGRHLVAVGGNQIQVVDASGFVAGPQVLAAVRAQDPVLDGTVIEDAPAALEPNFE